MNNSVGGELKIIAKVVGILCAIGSIIGGIAVFRDSVLVGVLIMIAGCLLALIPYHLLYGFAELVENSARIAENTDQILKNMADSGAKEKSDVTSVAAPLPTKRWKCAMCGCENPAAALKCTQCGTDKY